MVEFWYFGVERSHQKLGAKRLCNIEMESFIIFNDGQFPIRPIDIALRGHIQAQPAAVQRYRNWQTRIGRTASFDAMELVGQQMVNAETTVICFDELFLYKKESKLVKAFAIFAVDVLWPRTSLVYCGVKTRSGQAGLMWSAHDMAEVLSFFVSLCVSKGKHIMCLMSDRNPSNLALMNTLREVLGNNCPLWLYDPTHLINSLVGKYANLSQSVRKALIEPFHRETYLAKMKGLVVDTQSFQPNDQMATIVRTHFRTLTAIVGHVFRCRPLIETLSMARGTNDELEQYGGALGATFSKTSTVRSSNVDDPYMYLCVAIYIAEHRNMC